ncbi:MAG TPA: ABC transporter permease [Vicinamibacterales bacterium]|nr:ABC transporter permease [Vicinamibacterales bacterium]
MRSPALSLALRNLFRRPGFAVVALTLLALGAGANAAVFSVVRGVLLRPLPFPEPDRLVAIAPNVFVSNEDVDYWRSRTRSFEHIAALSGGWMMGLVADGGEPLKVTGARTSDNLFRTLGATAALGRVIEPGDSAPNAQRIVVLSDGVWRSRFGANPAVIGRIIQLDQEPHTIVGVMPPGFEVFEPGTDLWAPLAWTPGTPQFKATFSLAVGRLTREATVQTATRELSELVPAMRKELARPSDWGRTMRVQSFQESITGDVRPALLILLGAVGLILMLAAINLGTLVLGRSIERVGEMALRSALGASRRRLIEQVLVEQAVLAVIGSLAGVVVARALLPALVAQIPAEVPHLGRIELDWTVLATVLAASVSVAMLVALVPAALAARPTMQPLLRQSRTTDTPGRRRALGSLVAVQIGVAVVLGIGSMLMLRSLWNLQRVDPGFDPRGVLTFRLQTTSKYRALTTGLPYLEQVRARVAALPGVDNTAFAGHLPMSGYSWTTGARRIDQTLAPGEQPPTVGWRFVHGNYFQTMRIPLRYGRTFADGDQTQSAAVAIVNETLARRFFDQPSRAVGQTMIVRSGRTGQDEPVQIVGVVGDVRHVSLDKEPLPEIFRPLTQTFMFPMAMVVRTQGAPEQLAAAIRQIAFEVDPIVPVAELQPYTTLIAGTLGRPRLLGFLLTVFAATGLALGLVGVYGVVAYRVRQREREIGVRLALGATPSSMATSVVAQGAVYAIAGVALGVPAALLLSRVLGSLVFGVTTHDPLTFILLPLAIVLVTAAACVLPARRAARVDPVVAIRQD